MAVPEPDYLQPRSLPSSHTVPDTVPAATWTTSLGGIIGRGWSAIVPGTCTCDVLRTNSCPRIPRPTPPRFSWAQASMVEGPEMTMDDCCVKAGSHTRTVCLSRRRAARARLDYCRDVRFDGTGPTDVHSHAARNMSRDGRVPTRKRGGKNEHWKDGKTRPIQVAWQRSDIQMQRRTTKRVGILDRLVRRWDS